MSVDEMEVNADAEDVLMDLEDRPPPPPELLAFLAKNYGFEEAHFWIPGYGWEVPGPDGGLEECGWRVVPVREPGVHGEDVAEHEVPDNVPDKSEEAVCDIYADSTAVADLEGVDEQPEAACNATAVYQVESLDAGAGENTLDEPVMDEFGAPSIVPVSTDPYDFPMLSDEEEGVAGAEEGAAAELGGGTIGGPAATVVPDATLWEDEEEADWGGNESDVDAEQSLAGDSAREACGSRGGGEGGASNAAAGAVSCPTTNPLPQSRPGPSTGSKPAIPQTEIIISDDEDDSPSMPKLLASGPASRGRDAPAVAVQGMGHHLPGALQTTMATTACVPREPCPKPSPPPKPAMPPAPPRPAVGRPERTASRLPDAKRPRLATADGGPGAPSGPGAPVAAVPCPPPPSPRQRRAEPPGGGSAARAAPTPPGGKDGNAIPTQRHPCKGHDRTPDLQKPAKNQERVEEKALPSRSRYPATNAQSLVPPAKAIPRKHRTSSSHQWAPPPATTSTAAGEGACPPKPQHTSGAKMAVKGGLILPQRPAVPKPPAPPNSAQHPGPLTHEATPDQVSRHEVKLLPRETASGRGQRSKDKVRLVPNDKVQFPPKAASFRRDDGVQSAVDHNGVASSSIHNNTLDVSSTTSTQAQGGSTPSAAPDCPPKAVPATVAPRAAASTEPAPAKPSRLAQPSQIKFSREWPKSADQTNQKEIGPKPAAGGKGRAKLPSHSASHVVRQQERLGAPLAGAGSTAPSGGSTFAVRPPQQSPDAVAQASIITAATSASAVRTSGSAGSTAAPGATGNIRPSHVPNGGNQKLDGPRPPPGPPPPAVLASSGDSGGKGRPYIGSIRREMAPRSAQAVSGVGMPRSNLGQVVKPSAAQGHSEAGPSKAGPATASVAKGGGKAAASASRGGPYQGARAYCTDGGAPQTDNEGRPFDLQHVVVNFANVGATFGEKVLKRKKDKFSYEGVRRCVRHLIEHLGLGVIGVIYENYRELTESGQENYTVPRDIIEMCESVELTPRLSGDHHRSADDEMTIKCAYRRNCWFLDNDNYKDWRGMLRDEKARAWLEFSQQYLQMKYYFDSGLGTFDTLDGNAGGLRPEPAPASLKRPWVSD